MKQGQFPAIFNLSDLNGQNGFKIDGENSYDYSSGIGSALSAGDINGDGYTDILIGASGHQNSAGRTYVVFGGPKVGSNGLIMLSSLNGTTGFKLDGEVSGDQNGWSVSCVGDVNGDGVSDLLTGALSHATNVGRSYVVFGGQAVGKGGLLSLSNLNGSNGFKLDGESSGDYSGSSVSGTGDINQDGYVDFLIGAARHNNVSRSYVIFGGSRVAGNGLLSLGSLNGTLGFKLDGEAHDSRNRWGVGTEDINHDGYNDLLIGSPAFNNNMGRSYIVFGKLGIGTGGLLALPTLNGTDGFILDGENSDDLSGWSVSAAGDINGDTIADLMIMAWNYSNATGRCYVVFGKSGIGSGGLLSLGSLDGTNGFKIDGESMDDRAGSSMSGAMDINGDGYNDLLIGAGRASPNNISHAGRSYVIFGGVHVGNTGLLPLATLNGKNGFKLDGEVAGDGSGVRSSTAGDINGDGVDDFIIGAYNHNNSTGRTYVVFGDVPPVLVNNSLSLSPGATITLNATYLTAYDRNHNNNTLVFIPSAVKHGQFEVMGAPRVPLVNFTQQQVTSGSIRFVHDGTLVPPSYDITVRSDGIAWTGPISAKIDFMGAPQSYFPAVISLADLNGQHGFKIEGESAGDQSGISVSAVADINDDGYADLLIGASQCSFGPPCLGTGRSYVVFGGVDVGDSGALFLSNLNGTQGFKLNGEAVGDQSGISVSGLDDINGDGYADLLIGANYHNGYTGRSYVVFGGHGIGSSGMVNLSNLTSSNGFKLDGETTGEQSGYCVYGAADVNGDGYPDLFIGAQFWKNIGRSYVVLGGLGVGSSGDIALSSLTGSNSFTLNGETSGDWSGYSLSAGDINHDGYADLLIGAPHNNNNTGSSYVVFGGPGVGSAGVVDLSSLNGVNGFKLYGELMGDLSGYSLSAGDINGDEYDDLIIGAPGYGEGHQAGHVYVVFGGLSVGENGMLALGSLNGVNGFKIDGKSNSGGSVNMEGDINGDGYADAILVASGIGRSYIIFGGSYVGKAGLISLSNLNGINGFEVHLSGTVSMGGDVNGDGTDDFIIGDTSYNNATGRTYIIFGDSPPVLVQNRLSLSPGDMIPLNQTHLSAYDVNHPNNTIVFIPTNVAHGHFELISQPGMALINFTQPQLVNGLIRFVHDGGLVAPSYNITLRSGGIAWTGPYPANITFVPPTLTPMLLANQLTLSNGETVVLSSNNLKASEVGFNNSRLLFSVANVRNGYFTTAPFSSSPSKNLLSFTQAQIQSGAVEFVHAGNYQAPGYSVLASDGVHFTLPSTAVIDFIGAPQITLNTANTTTGKAITLTPAMLNLTITDGSAPSEVVLIVNNLQHATVTSILTNMPVNNFTLADVQAGNIQLTQDGSLITPTYTLIAYVPKTTLSSTPNTANVTFSNQGVYAPQLVNNDLTVTQGQSTTLSNRYLSAQQPYGGVLGNNTLFYVSNVMHGHFSFIAQPQLWISSFNQGQLNGGEVQFTHDGSLYLPSYDGSVQAYGLQSASLPAQIFFYPVNQPPQLVHPLVDQVAVVGQPFSYDIDGSFIDPNGDSIKFLVGRFSSNDPLPSWLSFNELSHRVTGIPTQPDFLDINVTAQDSHGLATTTDFTLTVSAVTPKSTGYSTIDKAIIGAAVSGAIGIFFALLQGCLKRAANKKLLQALGEDKNDYEQNVVRPVAKEIARHIKITGFMNYTTNTQMAHFKSAVRKILSELNARKVNLEFETMMAADRDSLINEIALQVRKILLPKQHCCSCPQWIGFFKAQATPEAIEKAAPEIAEAVIIALMLSEQKASKSFSALEMRSLSLPDSALFVNRGSKELRPTLPGADKNPPEAAQRLVLS